MTGAGCKRRQRRGRERQFGVLAETHRLVGRAASHAPARRIRAETLQLPQRLIEIVAVRRRPEVGEQR
jgi:hypothetical protein